MLLSKRFPSAIFDIVIRDIKDEIMRAEAAHHGRYTNNPLRRVAIVVEEAGEAIQAALDLTRPDPQGIADFIGTPEQADASYRTFYRERTREELAQCAAMAVYALMAMKEEEIDARRAVGEGG